MRFQMFKIAFWIIGFSIAIHSAASSTSVEYWHANTLSGKLSDHVAVTMQSEFRFGSGMKNYYYQHTHFEIKYAIHPWLTVAPAYRQVHMRSRETTKVGMTIEHLPQINCTGKAVWKVLEVSDRIRVERISKENSGDIQWRFRNKMQCRVTIVTSPFKLRPYLSDELFYLDECDGWTRNRFYLGVDIDLEKYYAISVYYMIEDNFNPSNRYHVAGANIQLKF